MFRSKDMEQIRIFMSMESAWDVINYIGEHESGMIVENPNADFVTAKNFVVKNKMLDQWQQRLSQVVEKCERFGIKFKSHLSNRARVLRSLSTKQMENRLQDKAQLEEYLVKIEEKLKNLEDYFRNFDDFTGKMKQHDYTSAIYRNLNAVLPRDANPFGQGGADMNSVETDNTSPVKQERLAGTRLMYYVGLIDTEHMQKFHKMVFRLTRGKVLVTSRDIGSIPSVFDHLGENYKSLNPQDEQKSPSKTLLFMFYIGRDSVLGKKVKAITSVFDVFHVNLPNTPQEVNTLLMDTQRAREEMTAVIKKTIDEIHNILEFFVVQQDTGVSRLDELQFLIHRERAIGKVLAQMEPQNDLYTIKLWIDADRKQEFITGLMEFCASKPNMTRPIVNTIKVDPQSTKVPTKFDLNEFTAPFQQVVDTYAIPKYKEINPAVFTAATFPFLFGVMFGDACHGLIIFIFGLYLLLRSHEFKRRGGVYEILASLRYLVTMLGFFSFYNGLVYNDFASIPLLFFPSCYQTDLAESQLPAIPDGTNEKYIPRTNQDCVYPFGIDWAWYMTKNDIPFLNSFKMKVAIILGVLQMLFGICLKGLNAIYFGSWIDFVFEFIPQLLFLGGLFGYMCVLIVVKWLYKWQSGPHPDASFDAGAPPQIINVFTSLTEVKKETHVLLFTSMETQKNIQIGIVITCLVCAVLMMFPKPILLSMKNKKRHSITQHTPKQRQSSADAIKLEGTLDEQLLLDHEENSAENLKVRRNSHGSPDAGGHHDEPFGELMVHQGIETIEFVLGSISNTASYLRLWALSLAHSQLSKVFLSLLLNSTYHKIEGSPLIATVAIMIKFLFVAAATIGVLLVMDAMECFLHTLRLHWVEFQSKFYKGEGLKYEPFCFRPEEATSGK